MCRVPRRTKRRRKRNASKKSRSLGRLILRLSALPRVRQVAILLLAVVLGINLAVRFLGRSSPFPLSPFHLADKSRALFALALHRAFGRARQPSEEEMRSLLRRAADQHRVPTSLAMAVAEVESGFIPVRISSAGAMGVMQLMPGTAADLRVDDPYDASQSIQAGVRYLALLASRYPGDWRRVAAAYNAGPANVPRAGPMRLTRETSDYVDRVQRRFVFYRALEHPRPPAGVLNTTSTVTTPQLDSREDPPAR